MRKSERGTRNRSAALQAETPASRLDLALLFRVLPLLGLAAAPLAGQAPRPRARRAGLVVGVRPITPEDVLAAIRAAAPGAVGEGAVGAGRGTVAFGWKGGIGTASRRLPLELGGWTVGALVQSNFGGVLTIAGAPVGRELGQYYLKDVGARHAAPLHLPGDGSIIIVVATDAPLDHRQLERLGRRALAGLARTGSSLTNGSGDYVIAFSTRRSRAVE